MRHDQTLQSRSRRATHTWTCAAAALVLSTLWPAAADASTFELDLHGYDGSNLICGPSLDLQSEPDPVSSSATQQVGPDTVGAGSGTTDAFADRGIVGMRMNYRNRNNPGFNRLIGGCSSVSMLIDDIEVTGPAGTVTAELNAGFTGELIGEDVASRTELRATVRLVARTPGGTIRDESAATFSPPSFDPATVEEALTSGSISFQTGDVLSAELRIDMTLTIVGHEGTSNIAEIDFFDDATPFGLSFVRDGAVLTLPDGYTASSVDGDIVDNTWDASVPVAEQSWGALKARFR